jgi:hypothetical protein
MKPFVTAPIFVIALYTKERDKTDEDLFTNRTSIYLQHVTAL